MNFKDAYKSYNDQLKGNPEVLDAILKVSSKPKHVFSYRPIMAYAAMAALVISVSVFGYSKFFGDSEPVKNYIASNNPGITDIKIEDSDIKTADVITKEQSDLTKNQTSPKDKLSQNKTAVSKQMPDANSFGDTEKSADKPDEGPYYTSSEYDVPEQDKTPAPVIPAESMPNAVLSQPNLQTASQTEAMNDKPAFSEEYDSEHAPGDVSQPESLAEGEALTDSSPMMARSGGGGAAAYSPENDGASSVYNGEAVSQMSADEYFEYLGIDIVSKAKLPGDMTFETPQTANVEYDNGVVVSDMFTLSAYSTDDPKRKLSLSVTKSGPYAGRFTDDISYAYTDDETVVGAYTMAGDVSLSLGVQNVTKEEINNLFKSLKTEE